MVGGWDIIIDAVFDVTRHRLSSNLLTLPLRFESLYPVTGSNSLAFSLGFESPCRVPSLSRHGVLTRCTPLRVLSALFLTCFFCIYARVEANYASSFSADMEQLPPTEPFPPRPVKPFGNTDMICLLLHRDMIGRMQKKVDSNAGFLVS